MIETKDLALRSNQAFRITHMRSQVCGHLRRVVKQHGKSCAVSRDKRILRIEYIEPDSPVIGVDYSLNAVAHVVDIVAGRGIVTSVRIGGAFSVPVNHPVETPVIPDYDIGIVVI